MKRLFATFVSCLALLSATVTTPALAEVKDEAEQSDMSVFQDAFTTAADGIQSIIDGVKTSIEELFSPSVLIAPDNSESADAPMGASVQDTENAAVVPSNLDGVVWDTGYTTCTLQSGYSVDGQALKTEIASHRSTLIAFKAEVNTKLTGSADNLFFQCTSLSTVDFGASFDTGQVNSMNGVFYDCSSLSALSLPDSFNTGGVRSMNNMFYNCSSLTSLRLPDAFDTSSVLNASEMFRYCSSLTSLTLPDAFDTSSIELMNQMFCDCSSLRSLTLPDAFNTAVVQNVKMIEMFKNCSSLISLTLPCNFVLSISCSNVFAVANQTTGSFALRSLTLPKNFAMKVGTGLPGLASQGSSKYYWTTSIDSCVNYGTTEDEAVANINDVLAASANSVTFLKANVTLDFNSNGGTYAATTDAEQGSTHNADEVKTLFGTTNDVIDAVDTPAPKLAGFKCTGWSASRDGEALPMPITFPAADATYYAVWTPVIAITFDTNGHASFAGDQKTLVVDCVPGEKLALPAEDALTVEPSYIFNGWFTEVAGGTQVTDETDCPATATTYYAQYTKEPGPTPDPTPEPTPDVVPASDTDALPLTGDTSAARTGAVIAVLMGTVALLACGYSLTRKRLQ